MTTPPGEGLAGVGRLVLFVLVLALFGLLGLAVLSLAEPAPGLTGAVQEHLGQSGVSHAVTAVLLNFRGYDTLLEMVVLVLAALGARSVHRVSVAPGAAPEPVEALLSLARLLVPVSILVAAYLLWRGAHAPGGAFQAGAILAAGGVLWLLAGGAISILRSTRAFRFALAGGIGVFLAVAAAPMAIGGNLLEYPAAWAGQLILLIELALTVSIGAILAVLFARTSDAPAEGASDPTPQQQR